MILSQYWRVSCKESTNRGINVPCSSSIIVSRAAIDGIYFNHTSWPQYINYCNRHWYYPSFYFTYSSFKKVQKVTNLEISSKYHLKRAGDTFLHLFGAYYIIVISPLLLLLRPELHTIMAPSVPLEVLIPTSLILYQKMAVLSLLLYSDYHCYHCYHYYQEYHCYHHCTDYNWDYDMWLSYGNCSQRIRSGNIDHKHVVLSITILS